MVRSTAAFFGTLAILFVVPVAGGTPVSSSSISTDECEWYCKEETNDELPVGRVCTLEHSSGEEAGPYEDCDTKDGIPELCMFAYGVEHCHECDITAGDCDGGSSLAASRLLSPSGTVLRNASSQWQSEDGVLRSGCTGAIVGYSPSAAVLVEALGTLHL